MAIGTPTDTHIRHMLCVSPFIAYQFLGKWVGKLKYNTTYPKPLFLFITKTVNHTLVQKQQIL